MFHSTSQENISTTTHYYYNSYWYYKHINHTMPIPYHETSTHTPPPTPSKWGPYSGAGDFSANMIVILIVLFCAVVLALALNTVIRYLFCAQRHRRQSSADADPEKPPLRNESAPSMETMQTQIFSAGTKLAGTEAECAICLVEFADGDRVHVLPACNHGFHVACIKRWLRTKSSCPTCRSRCQVAVSPTAAA